MEEFELTIVDLSRGGAGIGRAENGLAVFVPLTAPGDRVRVRATRKHRRYWEAELVDVLSASPERVTPRCAVFGRCGGCSWQHLPYERQWQTKLRGSLHALDRQGLDPSALGVALEPIPAADPWGYRNRIQLRVEGKNIGFLRPHSRDIVPIERCEIAREPLNQHLNERLIAPQVTLAPQTSYRRKLELELDPTGEVHESWDAPHAARGFRQVNDAQNERLVAWVGSALGPPTLAPGTTRELWDLYGGSGNFARAILAAAPELREIDCVDRVSPATRVEPPIRLHRMGVGPWCQARKNHPRPERRWLDVVLDPPREGLTPDWEPIARAFEVHRPNRIVLVGCDADAFARDLRQLIDAGTRLGAWRLARLGAIDLFPQTPHVEMLGLLAHDAGVN